MDYMTYPTIGISADGRIFPNVPFPEDYKTLVPKFYEQGRKEDIVEHVERLNNLSEIEIMLQWDNNLGLTNISIGVHGSLDLNNDGVPCFQEHNLGGLSSLIAASVAMEYVSELLKSR